MAHFHLQQISVLTGKAADKGQLVFWQGSLVAVLVHVAEEDGEDGWFLEAGFGRCGFLYSPAPPVFSTLDTATDWIQRQLGRREASES